MPSRISEPLLRAALAGLRSQEHTIREQIQEVERMLGGKPELRTISADGSAGKRRQFSAAVRRRMSAAQKARYARQRGEAATEAGSATPEPPKPKRRISPEGMKRIIAATKARWRRQKAEAAARAKTVRKAAPKTVARKKSSRKRARTTSKAAAPKAMTAGGQ